MTHAHWCITRTDTVKSPNTQRVMSPERKVLTVRDRISTDRRVNWHTYNPYLLPASFDIFNHCMLFLWLVISTSIAYFYYSNNNNNTMATSSETLAQANQKYWELVAR